MGQLTLWPMEVMAICKCIKVIVIGKPYRRKRAASRRTARKILNI